MLHMCAAASPTLMAFRPLKTCWPTSCWGSSCGWSLPPLVSATSLLSACVHTSDLKINSTPCALSPSAVSHSTFKLLLLSYNMNDVGFNSPFIILKVIYAVWHGKTHVMSFRLRRAFICKRTDFVQRKKVALKMWSCICKAQQCQFTGSCSMWTSLMLMSDWHSLPPKWTRMTNGMWKATQKCKKSVH